MNAWKQKLTLDQIVPYEITVLGESDANWSSWVSVTVKISYDDNDNPITTFLGTFDQAALHGFLRRLYSLGFPLISINLLSHLEFTNDKAK
jgi:hypothetical protein